MTESNQAPAALADHPVRDVVDSAGLEAAVQACGAQTLIALDTEFERSRTYYAIPALIQLFDGSTIWLVDPLALERLDPLLALLTAPTPHKVIHSASEDLELLTRLAGSPPRGIVDSQLAAGLAGLGPAVSYRDLVSQVCGVELEKSQTRSDWLRRPLSQAQHRYAALDVAYLLEIHTDLLDRINELGRGTWLTEDTARLVASAAAGPDLDRMYREFKLAWKLAPEARTALRALLHWRETEAARRDIPRRRVLADDAVLELAQRRPGSKDELLAIAGLGKRRAGERAQELLGLVEEALAGPAPEVPPPPLDREGRQRLKALKRIVDEAAEATGLDPSLLASRRDLLALMHAGALPERLAGWRRAVLGERLLEALAATA